MWKQLRQELISKNIIYKRIVIMHIGDKVRSIKGSEEGVVVNILSDQEVELEIEDGFRIPYRAKDLVVVSSEEQRAFSNEPTASQGKNVSKSPKPITADKGVYLSFIPRNDQLLEVFLVNNTDLLHLYSFGGNHKDGYEGIFHGLLDARSYQKVHELSVQGFESWPMLVVHAIPYRAGHDSYREPWVKKLRFRAQSFFKMEKKTPLINQKGYLFQLDVDNQAVQEETKQKLEGAFKANDPEVQPKMTDLVQKYQVQKEVDLHIEHIVAEPEKLSSNEMFAMQVETFEKSLDRAIVSGAEEIVFIHGVGNGKLKTEIQKRLSKNQHVEFFNDAKREKFGYGATAVKLL